MVWTGDLVAERFDSTQTLANDTIANANQYMAQLGAFLDTLVLPSTAPVDDIEFPEILPIDYSARPSFTEQLENFPTFDDGLPADPTLKTLPISDITEPSIVEITDPGSFSFTEGAYNSEIRDPLFAKILNDFVDGGTGLSPAVEADIYDRGKERQRVENERLYLETEDRFTATGFGLPSGALVSSLQAVGLEISRKNDQLNREITISQADLEQKNVQFSVDQAVKIESILTDFYNNDQNRGLEVSKAVSQVTIDIYDALTKNQSLKLDRYKTEAEVFKIRVESVIQENGMLIAQYDTRIKAFVSELDLEIRNAQLQVEAFKTEATVFDTETRAATMYYETRIKEDSLLLQSFSEKIKKQIAILGANTDGYVALKSLQANGIESLMNVNAQLGASATNAANVSASQSISSSTSN